MDVSGLCALPLELDEPGLRTRSILGEGLDASACRKLGRVPDKDVPTEDGRDDSVVGFFGLRLRDATVEGREVRVGADGGGAMLCRLAEDVAEVAEAAIEARLAGAPEML